MADLEFDVAVRRADPITFRLGGKNFLLKPALEAKDSKSEAVPEKRGKDDHEYTFIPPKNAVMLMPVLDAQDGSNDGLEMTKSTFNWLGTGLSMEDRERVIGRLRDPGDDLDVDTLSEVVEKLSERVAGRPTT